MTAEDVETAPPSIEYYPSGHVKSPEVWDWILDQLVSGEFEWVAEIEFCEKRGEGHFHGNHIHREDGPRPALWYGARPGLRIARTWAYERTA